MSHHKCCKGICYLTKQNNSFVKNTTHTHNSFRPNCKMTMNQVCELLFQAHPRGQRDHTEARPASETSLWTSTKSDVNQLVSFFAPCCYYYSRYLLYPSPGFHYFGLVQHTDRSSGLLNMYFECFIYREFSSDMSKTWTGCLCRIRCHLPCICPIVRSLSSLSTPVQQNRFKLNAQ